MGCTSPLVDSGGMMVCGGCSYLTDSVAPGTNSSNWASQLVTVRKTENAIIDQPHVLLIFVFDTAVSLTGIEMDLFLCPDWNIGAPLMFVYLDSDDNLVYRRGLQFVTPDNSPQSSCDSLSTFTFIGNPVLTRFYHTFYILVGLWEDDSID